MVESFVNVDGAPSLLRIETTKEGKEIKIPPFVKVLKDVTEDPQYASSTMARHNFKMPEADRKLIKAELGNMVTGTLGANLTLPKSKDH